MSASVLTLEPDTLTQVGNDSSWEEAVLSFVRRATQAGQTITVSAEDKLFTPQQAARKLMVSRSTISRRIATGQIRSLKTGNRHHIPYTEIQRLWAESMTAMAQLVADDIEAELFGDD